MATEYRVYRKIEGSGWWTHWAAFYDKDMIGKHANAAAGHGARVRVVECPSGIPHVNCRKVPGKVIHEMFRKPLVEPTAESKAFEAMFEDGKGE